MGVETCVRVGGACAGGGRGGESDKGVRSGGGGDKEGEGGKGEGDKEGENDKEGNRVMRNRRDGNIKERR